MDNSATGLPKQAPSSNIPNASTEPSEARASNPGIDRDSSQGSRLGLSTRLNTSNSADSSTPRPSTNASGMGRDSSDLDSKSSRVDAGTADRKLDVAVGSQALELNDAEPVKLQEGGMLGGYTEDGAAPEDTAIIGAGSFDLSRAGDSDDAVFPSLGGGLGVFWAIASARRRGNRKGGGASALGDAVDVVNPDGIENDEMSFQIVGQKRAGLSSCGHSSSLQGSCTVCNRLIRTPGGDASEKLEDSQALLISTQIR